MKSLGYLIIALSICLLDLASWRNDQPLLESGILIMGMAASMIGMLLGFLAHRKNGAAIAFANRARSLEGRGRAVAAGNCPMCWKRN
jgi:hypothetical protein